MTEHEPEPNRDRDRDRETQRPESEHQPDVPMIWVASLADYVNGRLHGEWIDPAVDDEELRASVQAMLQRSSEPNAEDTPSSTSRASVRGSPANTHPWSSSPKSPAAYI